MKVPNFWSQHEFGMLNKEDNSPPNFIFFFRLIGISSKRLWFLKNFLSNFLSNQTYFQHYPKIFLIFI